MKNSIRWAVAVVGAAALVAGCGSSKDKGGSSGGSKTPASTGGTATDKVAMKNIQFAPKVISVKVGDTITWTNGDGVDHNVVADSGADFKSNDFGMGQTYKFKPTKAGTIQYECTIHPGMVGTINVTK